MKNYLGQTLGLTLLVMLFLTLLSSRECTLFEHNLMLQPVDIYSDVRRDTTGDAYQLPTDTFASLDSSVLFEPADDTLSLAMPYGPLPPVDSFYFGQMIEDYTPEHNGLEAFFAAVDSIASHQRTVRIAFFGDSFIEGDLVVGDLRDVLQTEWGGQGVGFMPITAEAPRFRRTIDHAFEGWSTHSIVTNGQHPPYGINGCVYIPSETPSVRYTATKRYKNARQWSTCRLFYNAPVQQMIQWSSNGSAAYQMPLPGTAGRVRQALLQQPGIFDMQMQFPENDSLWLYGAYLEDGPGVYLDNFSVRGNSGGRLRRINVSSVRQFDAMLKYDLIVVQFGLNAASTDWNDSRQEWYKKELQGMIAHLKKCFPGRPIMIVSISDRAGKVQGRLMTLPSVLSIANMQRDLARTNGLLFFDLYHAMGGAGTMVEYAQKEPPLASADYTHLSHAGGRIVGRRMARIILDAYEKKRLQ
jgi:lysophospholipase L1-like esterase